MSKGKLWVWIDSESKNGACQGYVFAGTFGLLLRQASLGVNFCAPRCRSAAKPQKFPYARLKHNLATRFYLYY